jgi:hypothetical protein
VLFIATESRRRSSRSGSILLAISSAGCSKNAVGSTYCRYYRGDNFYLVLFRVTLYRTPCSASAVVTAFFRSPLVRSSAHHHSQETSDGTSTLSMLAAGSWLLPVIVELGSFVRRRSEQVDLGGNTVIRETPLLYYFARKNRHLVRSTVKATATKEKRQSRER